MKRLLPDIVKAEGYCCEAMWLRQTRRYQSGLLSRYLGVARRTVQYWKARWRKGNIHCQLLPNCQLYSMPLPHKLEDPNTRQRFASKGLDTDETET